MYISLIFVIATHLTILFYNTDRINSKPKSPQRLTTTNSAKSSNHQSQNAASHRSKKLTSQILKFTNKNSSHSDHYRKLLQAISLGDAGLVSDIIETCCFVCDINSGHIVNEVDRFGSPLLVGCAQHGLTDLQLYFLKGIFQFRFS